MIRSFAASDFKSKARLFNGIKDPKNYTTTAFNSSHVPNSDEK